MRKRFYALVAVAALAVYATLVEPYWIAVNKRSVAVSGLDRTTTVVHIADIHTTTVGSREARTMDVIAEIKPDYVFLTGDLFKAKSRLEVGLKLLSRLDARRGVFVVPGNGDDVLRNAVRSGAIPKAGPNYRILLNESVDCGDFVVVGIDDPVTCHEDVRQAFDGVGDSKPVFLLTHFHASRVLNRLDAYRVDVVFSGHTHGGQIGLPPIARLLPYTHRSRCLSGLHDLGSTQLHVTKGVGTNIFPARLACRPEINVIVLGGE